MKRIAIIGHFGLGLNLLNGQTIKTKIVAAELERAFGKEEVLKMDTHGGIASLFKLPFILLLSLARSKNVVILPAQNGLFVIVPLLLIMNMLFHRKIHYVVIGGWMPSLIENRPVITFFLKRIYQIYVETTVMREALEKKRFSNVVVMANCKPLNIISGTEINVDRGKVFRLCTFSRVMKQKGIEQAVAAIDKMNQRFGPESCSLDIYGQIEPSEEEWFAKLQEKFPQNVAYKGVVPFDKSVDVLKNYSALLFPTLFYTEGIPGTVIDAFAAGLPVIASRWASFTDIIDEGKTGFGYELGSFDQLCALLEGLMTSHKKLDEMRLNCIKKAECFLPQNALQSLENNMR